MRVKQEGVFYWPAFNYGTITSMGFKSGFDDSGFHGVNKMELVLISFVVGLTFGIQFMGFLAIPSIVYYYF